MSDELLRTIISELRELRRAVAASQPAVIVCQAEAAGMNTRDLIDIAGGPAVVARICDVRSQAVSQWISQDRVPPDRCEAIEAATGGAVTCEQLRPDLDWTRVGGRAFYRSRQLPTREAA